MKIDKHTVIIVVGIIISVVCSWLFARHIEWGVLAESLKQANVFYIIVTIVILMASYVVRALRWQSLMMPLKKIPLMNVFSATMIGFFANSVLPARAGELIKPVMLAKKENIKITSSLATVFLERIFDLLGLVVFTIVILMVIPTPGQDKTIEHQIVNTAVEQPAEDWHDNGEHKDKTSFIESLKRWVGIFIAFGVGAITALALLVAYPARISNVLHKIFAIFPRTIADKLEEFLASFLSGLEILGNAKHVAWILFLTVVLWVSIALQVYILGFAFDIGLPFNGACLVTVCIAFAVALPQAPGYIGVFHLAVQKTLAIFSIDLALSQSYAITLWTVSIIPTVLVGLLFLWKEGIAFKDLSKFEDTKS